MFYWNADFNQDLSNWDVSNVTDMHRMFQQCFDFNQDISSWNVSSVTDFHSFLNGALAFEGIGLENWDVSSVTNMSYMFALNYGFNQDISGWDVSQATSMQSMFNGASSFNIDLSDWDVSSVTDISHMFNEAGSFNQDISSWDVSNVTHMHHMFNGAASFNQDLSGWDVSSGTNMDAMFDGADALSEDNQCAIHTSFSSNENWPYDWSESCGSDIFQPQTKAELQTAVNMWVGGGGYADGNIYTDDYYVNNEEALETYGEINTWDVSLITDMELLFAGEWNAPSPFNDDI